MSRSMRHNLARQVTLRGLPNNLLQEVKAEARRRKRSVNQVLLERIVPPAAKSSHGACRDLLSLAGTWDEKRAKDFEGRLKGHRRIDPELWS